MLTYEELILLDNLIYLEWQAKEDEELINIVYDLLNNKNLEDLMDNTGNCTIKISKKEWVSILEQIENKPNLKHLKIKNVDNYKSGMRFACFVDEKNNATVVFRGTTTTEEWEDNGQGAYEYDTIEQTDALNYINSLEYNNITLTGHSKGGNKAQYVTVLSSKIIKCISVNGQGFSNEFINKYKEEINKNKSKIISINSKYDYVNCLFNSIAGESHYIQTEFQINNLYYHKINILLDENGNLRPETNRGIYSKIINKFSLTIISDLPEDIKFIIINVIIGAIELILCKGESKDEILKIAGGFLIMFCYENCFKYKEIFTISHKILEALVFPFLFWGEFINIEENNSEKSIDNVIESVNILGNRIISKLDILYKGHVSLSKDISKEITHLIYDIKSEFLQ